MKTLTKSPLPNKLKVFFNFGSILGSFLVLQIVTGIFLVCFYSGNIGFDSVVFLQREVFYGDLFRMFHSKGASFYFIFLYIHMFRGLFFRSFLLNQKLWLSGGIMFVLSQMVAFLGYVLPSGKMSFWGATVITKLLTVFPVWGFHMVWVLLGGSTVKEFTFTRFFCLHFLVPFMILLFVMMHVYLLHSQGSSNPTGSSSSNKMIPFFPFFMWSDLVGIFLFLTSFIIVTIMYPYCLFDASNFMVYKTLVTPTHMQPEWYFLPQYAVLRSCSNKVGGVMLMVVFLVSFLYLGFLQKLKVFSYSKYSYGMNLYVLMFSVFMINFFLLMWLGSKVVEFPFGEFSMFAVTIHFIMMYCFSNFSMMKLKNF